jgi:putative PIN family toxin of toxin-antitoxin system
MGKKIAPRIVIDTNMLISCLLFRRQVSYLRDLWNAQQIIPLLSKETFDEFRRVLTYPKFSLSPQEIRAVIDSEILPNFDVVETKETITGICRDPHDDKFLAVALHGKASYLVTGDQDLLELHVFHSTKIITPQEFKDVVDKT